MRGWSVYSGKPWSVCSGIRWSGSTEKRWSDWAKFPVDTSLINEIPVFLNEKLGISEFEEKLVFNTKEYWETLPVKQDSIQRVHDLQQLYGYTITLFSWRSWPIYQSRREEYERIIIEKGFTPLTDGSISNISKKWLNGMGLKVVTNSNVLIRCWNSFISVFKGQKKLVLEMGNPNISDTRFTNNFKSRILNTNRFQHANKNGFKIFIEDSPENALKLATLCDYVFLFDEPYNQSTNLDQNGNIKYDFPKNVIRVKKWNDIFRVLKSIS